MFNFTQDSYLERTSRPIYAIVFLLPFIVFYELGTILINTDVLNQSQVRVVAFVWLQNFLEYLGFGSKLAWAAPPLVVVMILVALQLTSRKRWSFLSADFWPMTVECVMLAVPLIVLGLFLNNPAEPQGNISRFDSGSIRIQTEAVPSCSGIVSNGQSAASQQASLGGGSAKSESLLAGIVTSVGAGIYEELVFRLILICALMIVFQDVLRLSQKNSVILAVLVSAALFSAHHHIVYLDGRFGQSAAFNWTEFGFRTIAGVYFAVLFAIRGFAVTAGTHAFYDIIATFINALFSQQ